MTKIVIEIPTGNAKFTKIDKPDTTYNPAGEYVVVVNLDKETTTEFLKTLEPVIEDTVAELREGGAKVTKTTLKLPIKTEEDGTTTIKAKTKASAVNHETGQTFTNFVQVFDANGDELSPVPMVGQGSKLKVLVEVVPYTMNKLSGISFRLKEVQIVDLVPVERTTSGPTLGRVPEKAPF